MRFVAAAFTALTLFTATAALAVEDHNSLAASLAKSTLTREQWDATMAAMSGAMSQQMTAQTRGDQRAKKTVAVEVKVIQDAVRELMTYDEIIDLMSGLLAKYYTDAELHELDAFYKSPIGQKSLRISPEVMRDTMGLMQAKVAAEMPALLKRLHARKTEAPAPAETK